MLRSAPLKIGYGSDISSAELNHWSELVLADLNEAVELQAKAAEQASMVTLLQSYEDLFLTFQQEEMAREFRLLRREIQTMELNAGRLEIDLPISSVTIDEGQLYGAYGVALPQARLSVDRLPADGVPPVVSVTPSADGVVVRDTGGTSAVADHRYDTIWLRVAELPLTDPATYVDAQLEIDLPEYVPTTRLNLLGLLPFPSWGLELVSADALTDSGVWQQIDGPAVMSGPRLQLFEPVHTRRIRLHLRQRNALMIGDRRVFVLGVRDVTALSFSLGDVISLRVPLRLPKAGLWLTGMEILPAPVHAQVQVQVDDSDILPVFIAGDEKEVSITIRGKELGLIRGVRAIVAT